ncbi:MAG: hypothetical protein ACQESC_02540 [Nanobdellota archaeon]
MSLMLGVITMKITQVTIILAVLFVLASTSAFASSVSIEPINSSSHHIFFDETAEYDLTIENTDDDSKVFTVSITSLNWIIDSKRSIAVDGNSKLTTDFRVRPKPTNFRGPGVYSVPFEVNTADGDEIKDSFRIVVKSMEQQLLEYKPSVALGISLDEDINPKDPLSVQTSIRNRNLRDLDVIQLLITAEHFSGAKSFPLTRLEERSLEFRFDLPNDAEPGEGYELEAELFYNNESINKVERFYDIIPYADIDREQVNTSKSFFKKTTVSSVTNNGNINKTVTTDLDISLIESIFTSVDISASDSEKMSHKSWKVTLTPSEEAVITVTNNYRSLIYLLIIAVIATIGYFLIRSPIVIKKQVIVTGKDEEGVSEMKVRIYIKNRTGKAFYNVRLLDKAPAIAQVFKNNAVGSVDPSKIVRTENKGTIIKWDFDSLEAYEERIVTYSTKARLKIIGNLALPRVMARFENSSGKIQTVESGKSRIGATSN